MKRRSPTKRASLPTPTSIAKRHGLRLRDLAPASDNGGHDRQPPGVHAARLDVVRHLHDEKRSRSSVAQLLGLSERALASVYRELGIVERVRLPIVEGYMVPTYGERRDCARYESCLTAHVALHPKGDDVPASCPTRCRWHEPPARVHPHAYASSGVSTMEAL